MHQQKTGIRNQRFHQVGLKEIRGSRARDEKRFSYSQPGCSTDSSTPEGGGKRIRGQGVSELCCPPPTPILGENQGTSARNHRVGAQPREPHWRPAPPHPPPPEKKENTSGPPGDPRAHVRLNPTRPPGRPRRDRGLDATEKAAAGYSARVGGSLRFPSRVPAASSAAPSHPFLSTALHWEDIKEKPYRVPAAAPQSEPPLSSADTHNSPQLSPGFSAGEEEAGEAATELGGRKLRLPHTHWLSGEAGQGVLGTTIGWGGLPSEPPPPLKEVVRKPVPQAWATPPVLLSPPPVSRSPLPSRTHPRGGRTDFCDLLRCPRFGL
ncbi:basic salivary proline-rich protein 3-like [Lepus europaeus]|uniref:basic salivary proline-rich protein 3-like n=1 Tax=Lepus europaeus TaxID=9983 RepID=UPI002B45E373|nr:basic salivary proline-rich protein 3-like [Lepus europaeus]